MKFSTLPTLLMLVFFLSINTNTLAQKLKDDRVDIKFVVPPSQKLPEDFKSYSVKVYGGNLSRAGISKSQAEGKIKMDGMKRFDSNNNEFGHLRVSVNTGYTYFRDRQSKHSSTKKKRKDGSEYTVHSYWYVLSASSTPSYIIADPDGNQLAHYKGPVNKSVSTTKYSKASTRSKNYSEDLAKEKKAFAKSVAQDIINGANYALSNFDFANDTDRPELYYVKKHETADRSKAMLETTKEVFKKMSHTSTGEEILAELAKPIAFWEKYAKKGTKDKKMKRLHKAGNFNLGVIYAYTDKFDLAKEYLNKVIKVEGKDKKSKRLLEKIAKWEERFKETGINSLHAKLDLSNVVAPSITKALEEELEKIEGDNNTLEGSIMINGEEIKGSIAQSKDAEELSFGSNGSTKFMTNVDNKLKEYDLSSPDITSFKIGNRNFTKLRFSPSAKGKTEANMHILEELYTSEKINLYKYYPEGGDLSDDKVEYAFKKGDEDFPVSLFETRFLIWKKGIAKYFADCPDLNEMCLEGGIKLEKDDLIKAARIYSEVCE